MQEPNSQDPIVTLSDTSHFMQRYIKCIFQIERKWQFMTYVLVSSMKGKSFGELCHTFTDTNRMINAGA